MCGGVTHRFFSLATITRPFCKQFHMAQMYAGFMPYSFVATASKQQAFNRTAELAASAAGGSSAGGGTILAALASTYAPTPAPAPGPSGPSGPSVADLRAAAGRACASSDMRACSQISQQLGAAEILQRQQAAHAAATTQLAARASGSITDKWFRSPTFYAPARPTTSDVASVAVSLSSISK